MLKIVLAVLFSFSSFAFAQNDYVEGLPIYYWQTSRFVNFGDYLSLKLVERIVGGKVKVCQSKDKIKKMLAIGSVLITANDGDVIWGTGMNGKTMDLNRYKFKKLDVHAVRGPLTRNFLMNNFGIECPEIYGDPALLLPYFFPEFKKPVEPEYDYIIIPHYSEIHKYPKDLYPQAVYPTDPWRDIIRKILNSKFVISGSLHGIIVAEAYNVPARYLRTSEEEPLYKYQDYYFSTKRANFDVAYTLEEALQLGGEPPIDIDLKKLYESFPFEYWPEANFMKPNFEEKV